MKGMTSMAQAYVGQKRIRRYFGKIREVLEMPNLIEVQKSSYDLFLRSGEGPTSRWTAKAFRALPVGLPDQGFQRDLGAGIRQVRAGKAEIRRRRMPCSAT
jgi:DNA-directed RNA polymerase beta subunit